MCLLTDHVEMCVSLFRHRNSFTLLTPYWFVCLWSIVKSSHIITQRLKAVQFIIHITAKR